MASFYVSPDLVTHGERQGVFVLGLNSGLMEILNAQGFEPTIF